MCPGPGPRAGRADRAGRHVGWIGWAGAEEQAVHDLEAAVQEDPNSAQDAIKLELLNPSAC